MDVPEIRIRKSSETPSTGSTGDVPVMAPMASFETLTDVSDWEESEHGDDAGTDKQSEGEDVFHDSGQNNGLSGSTGTLTEVGVEAGASDSGLDKPSSLDVPSDGEGSGTTTPNKPERPPSPMLSPSSSHPPRRPPSPSRAPKRPPSPSGRRSPSPSRSGRRSPSPARPPPPKSAPRPADETDDRELFEIDDDEDNSFIERKYGKGLETKAVERPRSTTPINIATLDSYIGDDNKEAQPDDSEKITISLPGSKKSKHAKKHEREKQSQQDAAESWMSFNQDQNLFSKSPVQSGGFGGSSQAYQAAPVVEAAPEAMKASWTTFGDDDDAPQVQQPAKKTPPKRPPGPARPPPPKLSSRRSMDAVAIEENDSFAAPPQNRRTSAPNAGTDLYLRDLYIKV